MAEFKIGDRVSWDTVNGPKTGEIEAFTERGIKICLPNGKCVYAHETSLKPC